MLQTIIGLLLSFVLVNSHANQLTPAEVPPPLKPWINWVLFENPELECPFLPLQTERQAQCQWATQLKLKITANGATFEQQWQLFKEDWVQLPSNPNPPNPVWVNSVKQQGDPLTIVEHDNFPSVWLDKGQHLLKGDLTWQVRPEFLQIPPHTALVELSIDGQSIAIPSIDSEGKLWLRQKGEQTQVTEENRADMRIYRQLIDGIPLQVITRIELDVAGKHREEVINTALLKNHIPMSLQSDLPARLENNGQLRIQVRPGNWVLSLQSRQPDNAQQVEAFFESVQDETATPNTSKPQTLSVDKEIWVFAANHELRLVDVQGVMAIDPQQTNLPADWKKYPTYLVGAGDKLNFVEQRRGDPEPVPDTLNLTRYFWLDFDGKGYTVQDQMSGSMTRGWRLTMANSATDLADNAELKANLGRVSVNGQDQFITRLQANDNMGVEVRRGNIHVNAESRLENALSVLPAVGWLHGDHENTTFQKVQLNLTLPPGWSLLHAQGVDSISNTWVKHWGLMDLFIVFVLTTAIYKLWGIRWGVLAFVTLVLTYQETVFLPFYFIQLVICLALLRVLPAQTWSRFWIGSYKNLLLIMTLVYVIPFMVGQMRQSLYPPLERPNFNVAEAGSQQFSSNFQTLSLGTFGRAPAAPSSSATMDYSAGYADRDEANVVPENIPAVEMEQKMAENEISQSVVTEERMKTAPIQRQQNQQNLKNDLKVPSKKALAQIDPNAQVQTGQGVPQWSWSTLYLSWTGLVDASQTVQLWLLSPLENRILSALRAITLFALTLFFISLSWQTQWQTVLKLNRAKALSYLTMVGMLALTLSHAPTTEAAPAAGVEADAINTLGYPSPELLEQLKQRLTTPPNCFPDCISSPKMQLELSNNTLQARLEVHSYAETAFPLPAQAENWLPQHVFLNNQNATALSRDENGQLWLQIPAGIHQVQLVGSLPNRSTLQLAFPMKPRHVTVNTEAWSVEGLRENGFVEDTLQFTRKTQESEQQDALLEDASLILPPFVQIERTLQLGIDWQVETKVTRLTPIGSAIVLDIPLLKGESLISDTVRLGKQGTQAVAQINLSAQQTEISWTSLLDKQNTLQLTAPASLSSSEIWRLDASAIWHVEISGIPVVHHQSNGQWLPEWRPFAGESVNLQISRPQGVEGQIMTIDRSQLIVRPSQRTTESTLTFQLRSSRGGQHVVTLPPDAILQSATINGVTKPIRQEKQQVTIPISPTAQQISLTFRQAMGIENHFKTPVVDLGMPSINHQIEINMPYNRWILFTGGQAMVGSAVMIWGVLIVMVLVSIGLGQLHFTPLKTYHWLLLTIVLSQIEVIAALIVVGWFLIMGWRGQQSPDTTLLINHGQTDIKPWQQNLAAMRFNLLQMLLVIWTIITIALFLFAIQQGLQSTPDMLISGNGSNNYSLNWFQDRVSNTLPSAWVMSLPLWIYRLFMLFWAFWLAVISVQWGQWAWRSFSQGGIWRNLRLRAAVEKG